MPEAYEQAGVSVEAGYEVVHRIKSDVERTKRPGVVSGIGGFGGLFALNELNYREPVLVSGTDGVGTKLMVAKAAHRHRTIGVDCVAMCVNDIIAQGAQPLFFLDYVACGKNDPALLEQVVAGVADGCIQAQSALIGGETAEMPGMYAPDEYDLAGFAVGVVEKAAIVDGSTVQEGDTLIGLESTGVHSNGFSLVRRALFDQAGYTVDTPLSDLAEFDATDASKRHASVTGVDGKDGGPALKDVLLTPTKIYVKALQPLLAEGIVKGMAHITGGGFIENIPRMLPHGLSAHITCDAWTIPPIFNLIERAGAVDHAQMYNVFNMGIGMVLAVAPESTERALALLVNQHEAAHVIGSVVSQPSSGPRVVLA
ncbi:phosphoribosylformylglycinamidine cyclo-ligase [Bifidobacterium bohemicum]|uniref:Phosphoribosylformylglycinamidine cyclo-ligase n=1 Tax=Bifidobacterium bohemicum DSM 22767 TaxID=1437606 RepID=A0A086ZFY1_9BIFI|nr:phosphoribosylformylglycinamidine cyclo-ligase [Bifidobacterium bohemicum]KFI45431.1 Phosphoribosylaminoimidazole (AIR) synthetase [Bifidobacterium bohemicum DSM 22767]SCB73040.1 phosphoribosylformylglycinamidine cyclo-ligase [Bifidobacterium bohemicum]